MGERRGKKKAKGKRRERERKDGGREDKGMANLYGVILCESSILMHDPRSETGQTVPTLQPSLSTHPPLFP